MLEYYWDIWNATKMGQYLTDFEGRIIQQYLTGNTSKICLEVSSGSGRLSKFILNDKNTDIAVDNNIVPLLKLKNKFLGENITPVRGDAEFLPFKNQTFDAIICIQTIEYVSYKEFLKEARRLLKDGGLLLFTSANSNSYKKVLHSYLSSHRKFYRKSFSEVCSLLKMNGFTLEKAYGYNWIPFKRASNSRFVIWFGLLERRLLLEKFPSVSPWVFFIAYKNINEDFLE